jgi:hypothetical protein
VKRNTKRLQRSPLRETNLERTPIRAKGDEQSFTYQPYKQKSSTEIDPELIRDLAHDGYVCTWMAVSVVGMPTDCSPYYANGWEPINKNDFGGAFAKYCERDRPADAPITVGGGSLMLMCRHKRIDALARAHEKAEAAAPLQRSERMVRSGIENIPGGTHPSAIAHNKLERHMERISIPSDTDQ